MQKLSGRSAFLKLLVDEGVTHLFGNPGTTELAIMEVVPDYPELNYILGLQEAVVVGMADGYARASNRLAAVSLHVAPGLGNAMGALYNAKFSGSPLIVTCGQQEQGHGLLEPLLYDPLVPIAQPMVKWAIEVTRAEDLPRIVRRAAKLALTPPTGPVFISLPGDVLDAEVELDFGKPTRVDARVRPSDEALAQLASKLLAARNPVILAGQELSIHDAFAEAAELAELLGAGVFQQPIPYTAQFPTAHPCYLGALTRSQKLVRAALEPFDLMLCLGADLLRMSVYSPITPLPDTMQVAHVSERDWELGKNYSTELALRANVKETLRALLPLIRAGRTAADTEGAKRRQAALARRNWSVQREQARKEVMLTEKTAPIDPRYLMLRISESLPSNAIVVEEALTSSTALPGFLDLR
ncbi:MAG: thiamine pyrophosphate-binding protein, partial [Proteobacteria bacterium]|nr:thiamine pyrophosphate-binding protein [Pseudomonadota bacterium]